MKLDDYTYRTESSESGKRYFVSFVDGDGHLIEREVSVEVFESMNEMKKTIRNQIRSDERHRDNSELEKSSSQKRTNKIKSESVENDVLDKIKNTELRRIIQEYLTKTERRRILKYYWQRMTMEEIAEEEDCSHQAVTKSIRKAKRKISQKFSW